MKKPAPRGAALMAKLRADPNVHDPEALGAWIGRRRHGKKGMHLRSKAGAWAHHAMRLHDAPSNGAGDPGWNGNRTADGRYELTKWRGRWRVTDVHADAWASQPHKTKAAAVRDTEELYEGSTARRARHAEVQARHFGGQAEVESLGRERRKAHAPLANALGGAVAAYGARSPQAREARLRLQFEMPKVKAAAMPPSLAALAAKRRR